MQLDLSAVTQFSHDLHRPEGAMVAKDRTIWAADSRGGCTRITPDGQPTLVGNLGGMPNGICLDTEGNVIVANIGSGQVQCLRPDGSHIVLATHADGHALTAPNFPYLDRQGRIWVSHSTDTEPRRSALFEPRPDGAIAVIENGQARLAATEVYFANGLTLDEAEAYLYVAETSTIRIMRFPLRPDGSLGPREQFGPPLGENAYPDGVSFDQAGNLWVTMPFRNAVGVLTPEADWHIVLEDPSEQILPHPSNLCFGGDDLCTAYVGNLEGSTLPSFRVPHPGMPLVHQL